jgi:hypothetical protein
MTRPDQTRPDRQAARVVTSPGLGSHRGALNLARFAISLRSAASKEHDRKQVAGNRKGQKDKPWQEEERVERNAECLRGRGDAQLPFWALARAQSLLGAQVQHSIRCQEDYMTT